MVSIIDSNTGLITGRTAAESTTVRNIDLSDVNNPTTAQEMLTGRNWSVVMDTGLSTARSALQTGTGAGGGVSPANQSTIDKMRVANQTAQVSDPKDPPFMMWNINDVRVGYDNDAAKKFNLDGSDMKAPLETLPRLTVDNELPYMRMRRKTQDPSHQALLKLKGQNNSQVRQKTSYMRTGPG
mmetsp:Transcript_5565/g.7423  ORF Transcript_5565/g.7423 Transcript_5565/m.7423 type:complete len:183 (-) Transcript_5565:1836-2384(-)|eukprot:CAMPEP_0185568072 /NCGR_PEP_ID=MMETSP0434-20130131/1153_1 /TAXON_ID=626734 ORGANISM="Favella taraikaensis, Strain Fe Narragansett Bay" /NCGR_SAMPLE_ID=MMETSP0434 /ASSEMBLY_ACC=CAM_ASM_000379 /LENGTH=182 /DNA_ID=CAMNT_0028182475 /DNA_START=359 /DNA_END=907 /DNA_ORIENTATION=-